MGNPLTDEPIWTLILLSHLCGLRCGSPCCGFTHIFVGRRDQLTDGFFQRRVLPELSCLRYLLPDKRDPSVTDRLHATSKKL